MALLGSAVVAAASLAPLRAQTTEQEQAVADGREAFGEGSYPWYDAETDSLTPMQFYDRQQPKFWNLGSLLNTLMWIFLALVLGGIVVLLIYFLRNQARHDEATSKAAGKPGLVADQVEALPFLAQRRRDDLLGQARYHYQQGNYSEAIIYLFSYQLLELDKFSVIRLAKGKTNRQYLRETARVAALRGPLERTMVSFEGVFFGRRPLDRDGFEACWNALPEFERQLRVVT